MRILLIEDEEFFANMLANVLRQEAYFVDIAADGEEGLYRAIESNIDYDMILLDLGLPGIDGMTVCKQIREAKPDSRIFILSARGQTFDRVKGLDIGADDYLTKPFSLEELLARMRALLRRMPQSSKPMLGLGQLSLDPSLKKAYVNGREINLTITEYMLLENLLRKPGITISQEELISKSWDDFGSTLFSTTLRTHIYNLRRKLRHANLNDVSIRTVVNQGYQITLDK